VFNTSGTVATTSSSPAASLVFVMKEEAEQATAQGLSVLLQMNKTFKALYWKHPLL
jgi:hypothetical protein